jgi:hypothetical protein
MRRQRRNTSDLLGDLRNSKLNSKKLSSAVELLCAGEKPVKKLYLDHNEIEEIYQDTIDLMTGQLESFFFFFSFSFFDSKIFLLPLLLESLLELEDFNISHNPLQWAPSLEFETLRILDLSNTGLFEIDVSRCPNVVVLNLTCNWFERIPPSFRTLKCLQTLFLGHNALEMILDEDLGSCEQLTSLFCHGNTKLWYFGLEILSRFVNLTLSGTRLSKKVFDADYFRNSTYRRVIPDGFLAHYDRDDKVLCSAPERSKSNEGVRLAFKRLEKRKQIQDRCMAGYAILRFRTDLFRVLGSYIIKLVWAAERRECYVKEYRLKKKPEGSETEKKP